MRGLRHVAKSVRLDDVAELKINDEAACEQLGVKLELRDRQAA